jgi:hypothetical protein
MLLKPIVDVSEVLLHLPHYGLLGLIVLFIYVILRELELKLVTLYLLCRVVSRPPLSLMSRHSRLYLGRELIRNLDWFLQFIH